MFLEVHFAVPCSENLHRRARSTVATSGRGTLRLRDLPVVAGGGGFGGSWGGGRGLFNPNI